MADKKTYYYLKLKEVYQLFDRYIGIIGFQWKFGEIPTQFYPYCNDLRRLHSHWRKLRRAAIRFEDRVRRQVSGNWTNV